MSYVTIMLLILSVEMVDKSAISLPYGWVLDRKGNMETVCKLHSLIWFLYIQEHI